MTHRWMNALALTIALTVAGGAAAENWPHWRGPNHNGTSDETGLPVKFSATENVKWTAELPGESPSTPIIHGDHVLVTVSEHETHQL
jgi:hypothetical protein